MEIPALNPRRFVAGVFLLAAVFFSTPAARSDDTNPGNAKSPAADSHHILWGICGHPTWPDYADWVPGNMAKQIGLVRELGCTYYRVSFEGSSYPAILDTIVPPAQSAGVTILPIFPLTIHTGITPEQNYKANYDAAVAWAHYAISKKYDLPYWELGNELENWGYVNVVGDGALAAQFPDKKPGASVAIASSLKGAYQGLKDAYAAALAQHTTTITPKILYGCTYRHWGLLAKIRDYNKSMPCDIISWHWYEPAYGPFTAPIHGVSADFGRTPAECLSDFKDNDDPSRPMDVWITETDRSVKPNATTYLNGSFSDNATGQDWPAQARTLESTLADLKKAPNVKAIFVYELLDENGRYKNASGKVGTEGFLGLMTGLNGTRKDAFYSYQSAIKANP